MKLNDVAKTVVVALMRNKLRSILTGLGIVVGIAAVVTVRSIGDGASAMMERQIAAMGKNLIMIFPEKNRRGAVHTGQGSSVSLTLDDCKALKRELGHVIAAVSPAINGNCQVVNANQNWNVRVSGVSCDYAEIRNWTLAEGGFFSEEQEIYKTKVCLIGETVRRNLFDGDEDVVGSLIRIDRVPVRVIGLLAPKGANAMGQDQDDTILMPYTVVNAYLGRSRLSSVNMIYVSLHSMDDLQEARQEISSLLRQRHNLPDEDEDDFVIRDTTEIMKTMGSVSSLVTLMLSILAIIALVVGGIGIMNVMLVSVTERIKEIGLRMSIGASPNNILLQFLLEAVVLSVIGGAVGVVAGIGVARLVAVILRWPVMINIESIELSLFVSSLVGVVFGFYPACKASKMNPIDCLRFE